MISVACLNTLLPVERERVGFLLQVTNTSRTKFHGWVFHPKSSLINPKSKRRPRQ